METIRQDPFTMPKRSPRKWHRWLYRVVVDAVEGFIEHSVLTEAAALAFYSALSLAPLLLLVIWGAGSLGFDAQHDVLVEVNDLLGPQAASAVAMVIENADRTPDIGRLAGWFSLGALIFSATGVFAQLQQAMNTIWGVTSAPGGSIVAWIRKRLLSLGLVVSLGFVLLISMVIGAAMNAITRWLEGRLPVLASIWPVLEQVLPFAIYLAGFMLITRVLPDRRLRWRDVIFSSLVIAALFTIGRFVIGNYLATYASESAYGAAGSLMAVLVWTYYSAIIVLFGTEISAAGVKNSERSAPPEADSVVDPAATEVRT